MPASLNFARPGLGDDHGQVLRVMVVLPRNPGRFAGSRCNIFAALDEHFHRDRSLTRLTASRGESGMAALSATQCLGRRIVSRSEAFSIPLTECGSPVGR